MADDFGTLRGKDSGGSLGESPLRSRAELKGAKIRRGTLLNSGLSIGISSEGKTGRRKEKKKKKKRKETP